MSVGIWKSFFASESPVTHEKASLGPAGFWLSGITGSDQSIRDPFAQNAWVYAACTRKAEALASAPLRAYIGRRGDAASQKTLPDEHELARLLASPSPLYASGTALISAISVSLDLYGEAPLVAITADGAPFVRGTSLPAELYLVLPSQLQEQIDKRTGMLTGWKYGEKQTLTADQVGMIRLPNPRSQWRGMSPLSSAKQGMEFDAAAQSFNVALMRNGADPGGTISVDRAITKAQENELRESWNARHRGSGAAGKVAVLSGGARYEAVRGSSKDMELTSWRDWSKDEIAAVLGVTKLELADLGDYNRASAIAAREWLWTVSIIPRLRLIEDALHAWLFAPLATGRQQYWAAFDTSAVVALRADTGERIAQAAQLALLYPLNVVNQRLELGMPDVDYGDAAPPQLAPLPEAAPVASGDKAAAPAAAPAEALNGAQIASLMEIASALARGDLPQASARALVIAAFPALPEATVSAILGPLAGFTPASAAAAEPVAKSGGIVIRDLADMRAKTASRVRGAISRQRDVLERRWFKDTRLLIASFRDEMLANAAAILGEKAINPTREVIDNILGPKSKWSEATKKKLGQRVEQSWRVSITNTGRELGLPTITPDETGAWFKSATAQTAQLVVTTQGWRDELGERLRAQWSESGITDIRAAEKVIAATAQEFSGARAMTIARTEAGIAMNGARDAVFEEADVEKSEWLTAGDPLVRSSHEAQEGEVRKRGEKFSNGLAFPQAPGSPASESVNCRCTVIPAL